MIDGADPTVDAPLDRSADGRDERRAAIVFGAAMVGFGVLAAL